MSKPRIRIWDAPTRLVHWAIVILVALAWWTEAHDQMPQHLLCGYALLGVVLFRLIWGVLGSSTARFSGFVRGPVTVARYAGKLVRGQASFVLGHNPMGGWSVVALLAVLAGIVGFGLFCVDVDGVESGPLAGRVSFDAGRAAAHWHHQLFNALLALIALHLCAIAYYAIFRRDDLVRPMLTGSRAAPDGTAPMQPAGWPRLIVSAVIAAAIAVWASKGFAL
ncbi:MAG: cytochrome b/b6 domain-containing protein [Caulobacteraceae bacterium]